MRVLVHRADCKIKGSGYNILNKNKEKIDWKQHLVLENCKMFVDQKLRIESQETNKRQLHAWIEGDLVDYKDQSVGQRINYNPNKSPVFFKTESMKPVYKAQIAVFNDKGIFV